MMKRGEFDHFHPHRVYASGHRTPCWKPEGEPRRVSCHSLIRSPLCSWATILSRRLTLQASYSSGCVSRASATFIRASSSYALSRATDLRCRIRRVREHLAALTCRFEVVRGRCQRHALTVPLPNAFPFLHVLLT
ncbi:hypothetical protein PENSPDRAFT_5282 [Peniophora sp. CONT]|nr:hypothetical protein PENSPDRAFT_5282 [Peniophora sp. CONT]